MCPVVNTRPKKALARSRSTVPILGSVPSAWLNRRAGSLAGSDSIGPISITHQARITLFRPVMHTRHTMPIQPHQTHRQGSPPKTMDAPAAAALREALTSLDSLKLQEGIKVGCGGMGWGAGRHWVDLIWVIDSSIGLAVDRSVGRSVDRIGPTVQHTPTSPKSTPPT